MFPLLVKPAMGRPLASNVLVYWPRRLLIQHDSLYGRFFKRAFDVCVAAIALLLLAPLMLLLAALVFLMLGRPIFFRQKRTGQHGETFAVTKFRTMTGELDGLGDLLPDADRLRPFGRTLRSYSLDELPQLFDVLRGKMSLVGPRPFWVGHQRYVGSAATWRNTVRPGITGLAQISGRTRLSWDERLRFDHEYLHTLSLRRDIQILIKTAVVLVQRDGSDPVQGNVPVAARDRIGSARLHEVSEPQVSQINFRRTPALSASRSLELGVERQAEALRQVDSVSSGEL